MANWASNPKGLQVVSAGSPPDLERDEVAAECVQEHRLAGAGRCDRQHGSAPIDGEAQTVERFFGKAGMTPQPLGWDAAIKGDGGETKVLEQRVEGSHRESFRECAAWALR